MGGVLFMSANSVFAAGSGVSAADAAWIKAMKAGDVAAVTGCYASDALVWVTGATLAKGTKEIRAGYEGYFAAYTVKDAVVTEMGSETVGNKSVGWGSYNLTLLPKAGGAAVNETGRYTEVAKRVGGKWVYTVDHASDDPAPSAPAK
jgi:ketosteroid isomerase-like protein